MLCEGLVCPRRTIGADPFGDPNCVHISSITTQPNQTYMVIVSDQDDFDAVLPVQTVRYINVSVRRPSSPILPRARLSANDTLVGLRSVQRYILMRPHFWRLGLRSESKRQRLEPLSGTAQQSM